MAVSLKQIARETAAKLIPHTTSVHNVAVIEEVLTYILDKGNKMTEEAKAAEPQTEIVHAPNFEAIVMGLQNQRNAALNEAALMYSHLQSANNVIRDLQSKLSAYVGITPPQAVVAQVEQSAPAQA